MFLQTDKQKTKRKERFRANCPKTHVQGCVDPSSRRKHRKEQNTKRREGIFKRSLFKFAKTVSRKEHRKTRKNHPHRSRKQISGNGPNRTQTATELQKRKCAKNFTNWALPGQNGKNVILKISSVLQPQAVFCLPNPNLSKIRTSEKTNLWDPEKFVSKMYCSIKAVQRAQRKSTGPHNAKLLRNPLFWRVSRPTTSWTAPGRAQTRNTRKKRKFFRTAKNDLDDLQNGIFEKPEKSENSEETWFPETAKNHFALWKQWFQKGGAANERMGGRRWTLETRFGGPQMNPVASIYRVFGWNRNYEGIAVPIPAKHFINGVWLE